MSTPAGRAIRIVLASEVSESLVDLQQLIGLHTSAVEIIGTATGDPDLLIPATAARDTDILLLDTAGRSDSGLDALRALMARQPPFRVVIWSATDELTHLLSALRLGVQGYLLKDEPPEVFVEHLSQVGRGHVAIDHQLAIEATLLSARSTSRSPWHGAHLGLSRREAEVLRLLASGARVTTIGETLNIGRETVRSHLRQVYRKLGVNDRAAAVAVAWREGMGS